MARNCMKLLGQLSHMWSIASSATPSKVGTSVQAQQGPTGQNSYPPSLHSRVYPLVATATSGLCGSSLCQTATYHVTGHGSLGAGVGSAPRQYQNSRPMVAGRTITAHQRAGVEGGPSGMPSVPKPSSRQMRVSAHRQHPSDVLYKQTG